MEKLPKQKTLQTLNKWESILAGLSLPFWGIVYFLTNSPAFLHIILLNVIALLGCLVSTYISKRNFILASLITIYTHITAVGLGTLIIGPSSSGGFALLLFVPVIATVLELSKRLVTFTTAIALAVLLLSLSLQSYGIVTPAFELGSDFPIANMFCWVLAFFLVWNGLTVWLGEILRRSAGEKAVIAEKNNRLLSAQDAAQFLTNNARNITNILVNTMSEQSAGASQQASAVMQITSSMEEMGQSAKMIAESTQQVVEAAEATLKNCKTVLVESRQTSQKVREGSEAVEEISTNFQKLHLRIQQVSLVLLNLSNQSREISKVLEIFDEFSSQLQLLALNASIEAAGAKGSGERFLVVAQEVKFLAESFRDSSGEIRDILANLQDLLSQAVLTAEESRKEAEIAARKVLQTGEIMQKVAKASATTAENISEIRENAEQTNTTAQAISYATQQQRMAVGQIIGMMQEIKTVAQQSVEVSYIVQNSVTEISQLTNRLTQTLVA
jgi:methyl-accepting chemotaxis protein